MNLHFATSERHRAEGYLADSHFNFLGAKAKKFILENLADDIVKGFRVQDPAMHTPPQVMTSSPDLNQQVRSLINQP